MPTKFNFENLFIYDLANNHQDDCGLSSTTSESISTAGITGVGLDLSPVYLETDSGKGCCSYQ